MRQSDSVFGIRFVAQSASSFADEVARRPVPEGRGPRAIYTANIDHIVSLHADSRFRHAYENAWAATIDGWPVAAVAKHLKGIEIPRITGADFFPLLAGKLDPATNRLFFVVSDEETAASLREKFQDLGFEPDALSFEIPPRNFETNLWYGRSLSTRIREHGATYLIMGVGSPKSEIWVYDQRSELGDLYAICIGAGANYFAGTRKRAPSLMRAMHLEWTWRLLQEPRRLFARYFLGMFRFAALLPHA